MHSQTQPHGKFYKILPRTATDAYLPKVARGHMVMVLGWAHEWNWVRVVTEQITSSAASTFQYIDYLPIYPSKKNQHNGIQLKLCNTWDAWTYTEKKSYVKMDQVYKVPFESLRAAAGADGRQYALQSKSWDKLQNFIRELNVCGIQNGPVVVVNSTTTCEGVL
ncbi:MAG: hypothetical protein MMC33_007818 [Icmadophila ericetorum]|nr:hypothetical protein [Icmadophila ericetorum]